MDKNLDNLYENYVFVLGITEFDYASAKENYEIIKENLKTSSNLEEHYLSILSSWKEKLSQTSYMFMTSYLKIVSYFENFSPEQQELIKKYEKLNLDVLKLLKQIDRYIKRIENTLSL